MKSGFPQFAPAAKLGEIGVSIVSRIVSEQFGWLFKRNHQEHDFGIDGQIEVVTVDGAVTGQMFACQIKTGKSFFKETNKWGFVYRGEIKHFNYLSNYPIPVVIVICDPESRQAYWAHFQPETTRLTSSGWTLTIPLSNTLSSSRAALEALLPEVRDAMAALQGYWRLNEMLMTFPTVMLMIDNEEVQTMNISWAESFFDRLRSTRELAYECQGKVEISFYGYDQDPRELFEIEGVRKYVALLDLAFPELFFFARTDESMATIRLFTYCVQPVSWETERSTPEVSHRLVVNFDGLSDFLERHFIGLNLMAEWAGLPEDDIKRISLAVMNMLGYVPPSEQPCN